MVELGELAERARHHPARVQGDDDALLPLGLVLHADRSPVPRGRAPRDGPRIVVGLVLPQALEHAARAGHPRAALPGVVGEPAPGADVVAAELPQVGVDVRGRGRADHGLPLDEVERSDRADVDVTEREGAAVARTGHVGQRCLGAATHVETDRATVHAERVGYVVPHAKADVTRERVAHGDLHPVGCAERQLRIDEPTYVALVQARARAPIDGREDEPAERHGDRDREEHQRRSGEREWDHGDEQQAEQPRSWGREGQETRAQR